MIEKTDTIKNLAAALVKFHGLVKKIPASETNPFFNSKYASLSNILDVITTPLVDADLTFVQMPIDDDRLITMLMHGATGEYISSSYVMKPSKADPQGKGSAITYQRRYALCAILGLNIEEDDDGNNASKPQQQQPAKQAAPKLPAITDQQLTALLGKMEVAKNSEELEKVLAEARNTYSFTKPQGEQVKSKRELIMPRYATATNK